MHRRLVNATQTKQTYQPGWAKRRDQREVCGLPAQEDDAHSTWLSGGGAGTAAAAAAADAAARAASSMSDDVEAIKAKSVALEDEVWILEGKVKELKEQIAAGGSSIDINGRQIRTADDVFDLAERMATHKNLLAKVPLFMPLTDRELLIIASRLKTHKYTDGSNVITAGEKGYSMYVIESGEAMACTLQGVKLKEYSSGDFSRRRDCHFADTPFPSILKHLLKGEGGAAE